MRRALRSTLLASLVLAGLVSAADAAADDDTAHACATDASDGQKLRDEGMLLAARAKFVQCSREQCVGGVSTDCAKWAAELESRLPTIRLSARDASGQNVVRVRTLIDGQLVAETLDGKPIPVDPGSHKIRFEAAGHAPIEQEAVVREGERARPIVVTLPFNSEPPAENLEPPPPKKRERSTPWPLFVVGGVSLAALGMFGYFGLTGQNDKTGMATSCAASHTCRSIDVDSARTNLIIADVALGVAIVALGVGAYMLVVKPRNEPLQRLPPH
jgi:hypothetical protein